MSATKPSSLSAHTPLRVQLVLVVVVLAALALALTGAIATTLLRGYLVQEVDRRLEEAVPAAERALLDEVRPGRGDPGGRGLPGDVAAVLVDSTGQVVVTVGKDADGDDTPRLPGITLAEADQRADPYTVRVDGGRWRVEAVPYPRLSATMLVAADLGPVDRTVRRLVALQVLLGLGVLVLLAGAAWWAVRRSLRPLVEVEHTAAAIAGGDLSQRVPDRDPRTEVGRLSAALNGMLGQIERAFRTQQASEAEARRSEERMRRFVADASHELRTPLTSIRGFAELYRQGAVDPADLERIMRRIEDEAARMGLLVDDLLLLARLDQQRPLDRRPVDLLEVATDVVHDAALTATDRSIDLEVRDGTFPPVVTGDEARLRQVLGNLVSNALTHTPAGTPVTVRLSTRDAVDGRSPQAVLEVSDAGPGLSPEEAERVFERFYRADSSRTRASGGTGLGLSIVAALTAAHGGRVEVDSAPGEGATFRVLLPAAGL